MYVCTYTDTHCDSKIDMECQRLGETTLRKERTKLEALHLLILRLAEKTAEDSAALASGGKRRHVPGTLRLGLRASTARGKRSILSQGNPTSCPEQPRGRKRQEAE